jgi:hypothetical protein
MKIIILVLLHRIRIVKKISTKLKFVIKIRNKIIFNRLKIVN